MNNVATIAIDCERMKNPHTGLYHFCKHLGKSLISVNSPSTKLCYYIPAGIGKIFGDQCYIKQHAFHKLMFPSTRGISVWHSTHQGTDYFPRIAGLKIVLTIHDLNYLHDGRKSEHKKKMFIHELQKKIDRADHLTAVSAFAKADVQRIFDTGGKPFTVIYNGCNIEGTSEAPPPASGPQQPFLFTIGTIMEKKNFHVLPSLLKDNGLHLVIAGISASESYRRTIIAAARAAGVEDRLIFPGAISESDKRWYLQNCVAFVFPSLLEGFGLPVIEAMHFGKPVFLSRHTSLPEIGGEAAYYFKDFEPGTMRQTFEQGMADFANSNRNEKVRARAADFDWLKSARQYLEVYHSLL